MQKPPLPPKLLARARELRRTHTDTEQLLWQLLRNRQINGAKFRRQHVLGNYILDFYCHESQLAIELDGSQHTEPVQQNHDAKRTAWLAEQGITEFRFWNNEIFANTAGVLQAVWDAIEAKRTTLPPTPSRWEGE